MSESTGNPLAIRCRGLTRRFGPHVAVDGLDLDIPACRSFGLLGANGAGKTTFIRLVTGFLLPSAGSIEVFGVSPARSPAAVQRRLGFVMETSRLYPELRVRGFLRFCGGARDLAGEALDAAIERVVERFQIGAVIDRLVGHLSKGYQQRVSLAQAFLHEPELVIVDEPTSGLDPVQQREVQDMLASLRGERTVLVCTHDLHEAEALTERVAVLRGGRLIAEGETASILGSADPLALFRGEASPA
ncbi:MAG: ABC transporter ATP-binding protein [Deltaproteobacteria bacterium]|nr:ABC transporter ATP-binding protein [Deltaproteobacteria bacterium]